MCTTQGLFHAVDVQDMLCRRKFFSLVLLFLLSFNAIGLANDNHLLISEAVVTPTSDEFIEIANPTVAAIALDNYYLSDDEDYALLPGTFGAGPAPSIASSDFIVQFPAGATIPAGAVIVVAFDGAGFFTTFGFAADFEIHGTDPATADMIATDLGSTAGLTNSGENVVLFSWDGASDLVLDVDMLNIGTPSSTNDIGDKTGLSVDGPDADAVASNYLGDAFTMPQQAGDPGFGTSAKRVAFEVGNEVASGGNGITGNDETTENISITWDGPPFSAPDPGIASFVPALPVFVVNEIHADPDATNGDANGDGVVSTTQDEFVELVNSSGATVDISGWTLSDGVAVRHTFPSGTSVPDQCAVVVFSGGSPTGTFGGAIIQSASSGALGLNNGGDTITLNDGSNDIVIASYGSEGGDNQSLTLDPDITGSLPYVKHSLATGSGGALFSPGTQIDGSMFPGCPEPPTAWVINEIHADPDAANGDANGDGTVSTTQDEFVEIVNNTGGTVDISGWTISDGVGVRHTFAAGTSLPDQCAIIVFSGGSPVGDFGGAPVQTASTGTLGLNNGGDTITLNDGLSDVATASYGSEGANNQSLTREPDITGSTFVLHTTASGSGGALFSPGTQIDGTRFPGCPLPWVINEIHADPANGSAGDANGDGTRDASDDEFVEIVNNTGNTVDISGWTLADGVSVRHTFPSGTVLLHECAVVVFGGGTPTGTFAQAVVQTASTGSLGLNNGGDTITLSDGSSDIATATYGGAGGDDQSLTLDPDISGMLPYVKHSLATESEGALFSPGTLINGSQFPGCPAFAEIYEIQGNGLTSPFENRVVTSLNNVVTCLAPNGFFMQTPASRSDGDDDTSDGLFVFTGSSPAVSVGDLVDVTGQVIEFFGFTEFSNNPTVSVVGTGVIPSSVIFDATRPSPDPTTPSCSANNFECFEAMLVDINGGAASGPNGQFDQDPTSVQIVAGSSRAFREPGVEFPGLSMPPIPTWDGNPQVFELDPDKLGLPNQIIPAGSSFSGKGVLGFEFSGYEFWPNELTVSPATLPAAVREREDDEATIGSLNLFRLFDDVDDPPSMNEQGSTRNDQVVSTAEYQRRRDKLVVYILNVLRAPDILAVQEAEKVEVLQALANDIAAIDASVVYSAYLVEGNDVGTIDIGFLVRDNVQVDVITQLGKTETFTDPTDNSTDLVHDRPPLLLEGQFIVNGTPSFPIAVLGVHNRSFSGIDGSEGPRVRQKRLEQAQSIAEKVQDFQTNNPAVGLVVTGDFNDFEFTDGYVDVVGQISGNFDPDESLLGGPDLVNPNLTNQVLSLSAEERYSFIFGGSAQVLDHALTSVPLNSAVKGFAYGRGNADAATGFINDDSTPLRSSDHDGLVLFVDIRPPQIIVDTEPVELWPPNHEYHTFEVADFVVSVTDGCSPDLSIADVFITSVTSDEPENGAGDGNTSDDIVILDCQTVDLRSERAGGGNGRVYTVNIAAQDLAGNVATAAFAVHVPHSKKSGAVDDGPVYEVQSQCTAPNDGGQTLARREQESHQEEHRIPTEFALEQNYPNPFNPETAILFHLPKDEHVSIRIFNALGQEVRTLVDANYPAGSHDAVWDGTDQQGRSVASGLFIYQLQAGSFTQIKKMLLLR